MIAGIVSLLLCLTMQTGVASWGYFGGHVVSRWPRGTVLTVCGNVGCRTAHSWGYGPAKWTGRLVDLDVTVFRDVCGWEGKGLCRVSVWTSVRPTLQSYQAYSERKSIAQ